jgi:enoyl-CoA hydratase
MTRKDLLLRVDEDSVTTLTLNRPNKLNALDYASIDALQAMLDEIEMDARIRVVILTGAGDRAFSAGADLESLSSSVERGLDTAMRDIVRRGQALTSRIEAFPKTIIAAVNGLAYGAGCEITEAAPLAVASDRARFAKPEIARGFPPPFGGTQRLPRLIGRKRALAMILTGVPIDAHEALHVGLVNSVVPHDHLLAEARLLAQRIAVHSPLTISACLASVTRGINLSIDEGLAVEAAQFGRTILSGDARDGLRAFLDRRAPVPYGSRAR